MNTVRAKLRVDSVKKFETHEEVSFWAVYDSKNPEDNNFAKATPSATLTMSITNPNVFGYFKPGEKYYLNFLKVPSEIPYQP